MSYYTLDLGALRALPPEERFRAARTAREAAAEALGAEARRAAVELFKEEQRRHAPGAPTRAAKRLGISHQRLAKILEQEGLH